jgi:hypothetical protein
MNQEPRTTPAAEVDVTRAAQLSEAYRLFVAQHGWAATQEHFRGAYRGTWPSLEAYGRQLISDLAVDREYLDELPDWLTPYLQVDYARLAVDDLERDRSIIQGSNGQLHVFDRYADPPLAGAVKSTTPDASVHQVA